MKKKILINAIYPEEKRVAIVDGDTLVDFYVEASGREHLKGNIYKGSIARIEPGLQAVFVNFGPKKHGFLQLREITQEFFVNTPAGKRPRVQDLHKGQEMIVQVEKDERDTKGASLTTYISIPGRYIVMMPGQERVGISRKIEDRDDRERLKEIFHSLKLPKNMGFILRTAGSDKTGEDLENDLKYLTKLWSKIQAEAKKASAPALIYKEQDIGVRTVRDYLTSDVSEVLIDDQEAFRGTKEFLRKTVPWRKININFYKDKKPIFSIHNIEDQIAKLNERYVHLPSKGYVVLDKTEALTAIDVNSGRSRKEENVESTALRTNLEAADEIARQLRLRDIGGLIVIDFIDMVSSKNRRELENRLRDAIESDKAHSEITSISKFGIIEMTRERMRPAYFETVNKKCEVCGGLGIVRNEEMIAISAFREVLTIASKGGLTGVTCRLPVEAMNYLVNSKPEDIRNAEKEYGVKITLLADRKLLGQHVIETEKAGSEVKTGEHEKSREGHPQKSREEHPQKLTAKDKARDEVGGKARPEVGGRERPDVETVSADTEGMEKGETPAAEEQKSQEKGQRKRRYRRRGRSRRPRKDEAGKEVAAAGSEDRKEHTPEQAGGGHIGAADE
jgi:ribonuclease E